MLKPLHDNVVLKKEKIEKETKTVSGIILTEKDQKKPSYATVVAIGPKCKADIKEMDKVVYKEYSGTSVTIDDEEFILVEDEDILAVITK